MSRRTLLAGTTTLALTAFTGTWARTPRSVLPQTGAFGFDVAGMDRSVKPGDDFTRYAVGRWVDTIVIPPERSSIGSVAVIKDTVSARVREVIEAAAETNAPNGSDVRKVGDYFKSFIDEARIEQLGITPLTPDLDAIVAIGDRRDLATALGSQLRSDADWLHLDEFHTPRFMALQVAEDLNDATRYRPYLLQGGLGMPDRDYYLDPSPRYQELRGKYEAHVATMLRLAGFAGSAMRAKDVIALETAIARVHASAADTHEMANGNTVWRATELDDNAPGLDWTAFLAAAGLSRQPHFGMWQPSAVSGLSKLTASEPLGAWKNYLAFHVIEDMAPVLPKAFADEHFAFNARALSGTLQQSARWRRGVDATSAALGEPVGKLYVARYFPLRAKAEALVIARNVLKAFATRLDRLEWMGPATKAEAKRKLANFRVMIGYPDTWRDYTTLRIVRGDAYGNLRRSELFEYHRNLARLGRPVDRSEWFMNPQTVDALFAASQNSITLPAAILAPTFFDPDADAAVNYGALGAGLGHEVTHGFDDNGALFDAKGNLRNWWTPADMEHFRASVKKLSDQYSAYEPLPGMHINGEQTSSENIADLGGLAVAWDAYRLSLAGRPAPVIDGFSAEQRFYLSFAQNMRAKFRDAALRRQIIAESHAPSPYRALTARNLDGWYAAFDVQPNERLYLAPDGRVRIW